jgi:asparagine synthase (glutamine-hydrolysing)
MSSFLIDLYKITVYNNHMCGIVGCISPQKEYNEDLIAKMNKAIFHRGPDGAGEYTDECVGLGMRRLAIIDLHTGDQPIWNKDKTKCIFFNGEIYNYKELRRKYLDDHNFDTESDTETILAMYEKFGNKTPNYLRGMFAFVIYNTQDKTLFTTRDHFGIKPLYYLKYDNKILAFGSEIKSILEDTRYTKIVNHDAVYHYLQYQYNPLSETFFKNIFTLPPGTSMHINAQTGEFTQEKYFEYNFNKDENLHLDTVKSEIVSLMKDSVAHHAIADVSVGSFLSGGVDSSINATLLSNTIIGNKIHTFTIGSKDVNEFENARQTSDTINSIHHEQIIDKDTYRDSLPKVVWHFDEPVADPSAVLLYHMSENAAKEVKVVLSGEGADEFFGGYTIYREYYDRMKLNYVPKFIRENILRRLMNSSFRFKGKNYLKRYFTPIEERYIGNVGDTKLFSKKYIDSVWIQNPVQNHFDISKLYNKTKDYTDPTKMQYIDIHTWMIGDILAKADKMTMAHSLELRVPFLDTVVAEYTSKLPDKLKFSRGTTKFALRAAFSHMIPKSTSKRRKLGFPTALNNWIREDIDVYKKELLNNEYLYQYIPKKDIESILVLHKDGQDNSRKIYALYLLSLWHKAHFNNNKQ